MNAPIHLVPTHHMAATLYEHLHGQMPTRAAADELLLRLNYGSDDVEKGLDEVMTLMAAAVAAAASNRPWARALGLARDLTAFVSIVVCVYLWAVLA